MLRGEFRKLTERIDSQLPDGTSRDVRDLIRAIVTKEVTKCCESISKQIGEKLACALSSAVALSLMGKRLIIPQFDRLVVARRCKPQPVGAESRTTHHTSYHGDRRRSISLFRRAERRKSIGCPN
jgi:hypothetical protein